MSRQSGTRWIVRQARNRSENGRYLGDKNVCHSYCPLFPSKRLPLRSTMWWYYSCFLFSSALYPLLSLVVSLHPLVLHSLMKNLKICWYRMESTQHSGIIPQCYLVVWAHCIPWNNSNTLHCHFLIGQKWKVVRCTFECFDAAGSIRNKRHCSKQCFSRNHRSWRLFLLSSAGGSSTFQASVMEKPQWCLTTKWRTYLSSKLQMISWHKTSSWRDWTSSWFNISQS